jgi:hypothetical protein
MLVFKYQSVDFDDVVMENLLSVAVATRYVRERRVHVVVGLLGKHTSSEILRMSGCLHSFSPPPHRH